MPFDGVLSDFVRVEPVAIETKAQRIIREARGLLAEQEKWCRGDFQIANSYCILGALRQASTGNARRSNTGGASYYVRQALRKRRATAYTNSIQGYNDRIATHGDVLTLLDEAYVLAGKAA